MIAATERYHVTQGECQGNKLDFGLGLIFLKEHLTRYSFYSELQSE